MFGDLTRVGSNLHTQEAYYNLKRVNGNIGTIQSRLSTGKRINSAEDDTSGYALAKHMESRVRGLSQALDNVGTAKNVLNIAEGGYQSQMSILQTVKEKLTQAADGSYNEAQRGAIGDQIEELLSEFDDISDSTTFNGIALFSGTETSFQVGEGNDNHDSLAVAFDISKRDAVGEDVVTIDTRTLTDSDSDDDGTDSWAELSQSDASTGIGVVEEAIESLSKTIQKVGDFNARLSSKEESLSLAISNTEATRSRVEDADFAKEQMDLMKLSILQQTTVASFAQSNSSSQMVLALFQ